MSESGKWCPRCLKPVPLPATRCPLCGVPVSNATRAIMALMAAALIMYSVVVVWLVFRSV